MSHLPCNHNIPPSDYVPLYFLPTAKQPGHGYVVGSVQHTYRLSLPIQLQLHPSPIILPTKRFLPSSYPATNRRSALFPADSAVGSTAHKDTTFYKAYSACRRVAIGDSFSVRNTENKNTTQLSRSLSKEPISSVCKLIRLLETMSVKVERSSSNTKKSATSKPKAEVSGTSSFVPALFTKLENRDIKLEYSALLSLSKPIDWILTMVFIHNN